MKKLNVLILVLVGFVAAISSCSKPEKSDNSSSLYGKWTYDTYTYTDATGTDAPRYAYEEGCSDRKYFEFKSGGALEFGIVNPAADSQNPCKLYTYPGTWKLENKSLLVNVVDDPKTMTIVSVSATDLVFKYISPNNPGEYYTFTLKKS